MSLSSMRTARLLQPPPDGLLLMAGLRESIDTQLSSLTAQPGHARTADVDKLLLTLELRCKHEEQLLRRIHRRLCHQRVLPRRTRFTTASTMTAPTSDRRKPDDVPQMKWVSTVLGTLETSLSGAYHWFKFGRYADSYFGAFAYRFNRRFDLSGLVVRWVVDMARHAPRPLRVFRQSEVHC